MKDFQKVAMADPRIASQWLVKRRGIIIFSEVGAAMCSDVHQMAKVLRRMQGFFQTDLGASQSEPRKRDRERTSSIYALSSLVPNITKMDKASIVGDVVLYVQEMQMKAKKLKAEIIVGDPARRTKGGGRERRDGRIRRQRRE
ncbi:hypothetical protein NE237_008729 [Protea cynaroides]|uniref:BHLH domain-containing protein n=1 Tax=Protea cynaroides TaxID=273540 RepID=A0A9Q0KXB4_9MAGN|nr:hypothetical protein NE237_008729 [Protea cynaroides]